MKTAGYPIIESGTLGESRRCVEIGDLVVSETVHLPGTEIQSHAHALASLNLVLAGRYGEQAGGEFRLHPPATLIAKPAGKAHANRFDRTGARCLLIEFQPNALEEDPAAAEALRRSGVWPAGTLAATGVRILRALRRERPLPVAIEDATLDLVRMIGDRRPRAAESSRPSWLKTVQDRIHATAPGRLRLAELAAEAQVHPSHLSEVFRRAFGVTISRYVERLRLDRAVRDLAGTEEPIARVAIRSGFYDHAHLTRVFRRATGTTPSRFRRTIRS